MSFRYYTLLVTYFMASLGLLSAGLVEEIGYAFVGAAAVAAAFSLVLNIKGKEAIPGNYWNLLAGILFVLFVTDYLAISRSLITASTRFLTILLILKLFDLKRTRDYLLVYVLSFFQVLAAAASTVSPAFFAILTLLVIGGIWAMIVLNMKKDWDEARSMRDSSGAGELPSGVFGIRFFAVTLAVSMASIITTLAIFFTIPRLGVGFFESKTLDTVKVTGFSDTVDLGVLGPVKTDSTVVMRVELPGYAGTERPAPGYLRGTALEYYDGRSWKRTLKEKTLVKRGPSNSFRVDGSYKGGKLLEQVILLEPLDTEVIFAAPGAVTVEPLSWRVRNLWVDGAGSVYFPSPPYSRVEYRAWSRVSTAAEDHSEIAGLYTDTSYMDGLPEGGRIRALFEEATKGARTDFEKAKALEAYLGTNYSYTLDPRAGGGDPLTDFLFRSKEGYCEHYATAFALMLRTAGVPTRLVTGFLQGEWNSFGGYYIVRQQDAHSWVEAYLETPSGEKGWVTFDPTPPAGLAPYYRPSALSLYLDLLRWRWNRYIVQYSFEDQRRVAVALDGRATALLNRLRASVSKVKGQNGHTPIYAAAAAIAVLVAFCLARFLPRRKRASRTPRYYEEMLKVLRKKGYPKAVSETPLEFAGRVGLPEVMEVTEAFQKERYGKIGLSGEEASKVARSMEVLRGLEKAV